MGVAMRARRWIADARSRLAGLAVLALVLAACAGTSSSGTSPAANGGPIKVGLLIEETGTFSFGGQEEKEAAELFQDKVNASGGVGGRKLQFIYQDTQSNPELAVTGARKLAEQDGVVAIVGLGFQPDAAAVAPAMAQNGPPTLIISGAFAPQANQPQIFAFNPSPADLMGSSLRFLKAQGKSKVGLLTTNDATGQVAEPGFRNGTSRNGLTNVGVQFLNPDATSAASQLTALKQASPDALVVWTVGKATGVAAVGIKQVGLDTLPVMTTEGNVSQSFLKQVSDLGANFLYMEVSKDLVDISNLDPKDPQYQQIKAYRAAFTSRFNASPGAAAGGVYDALNVLVEAMRRGGADRTKIGPTIEEIHGFVGIQGTYDFAKESHRGISFQSLITARIQQGNLVVVK